jgi:hypothetical protein
MGYQTCSKCQGRRTQPEAPYRDWMGVTATNGQYPCPECKGHGRVYVCEAAEDLAIAEAAPPACLIGSFAPPVREALSFAQFARDALPEWIRLAEAMRRGAEVLAADLSFDDPPYVAKDLGDGSYELTYRFVLRPRPAAGGG